MQAAILKCRSGSRFHLGEYSSDQNLSLADTAEYFHSDVLFGAFISSLAHVNPDKIKYYKTLFETGKIKFSSAFYCVENKQNEFLFLLPKPQSLNLVQTNEHKKLKKVKYISKAIWERGTMPYEWFGNGSECVSPNPDCVFHNSELEIDTRFKLSEKADNQKVRKRTTEEDGNLYTQTDLVLLGNNSYAVHWYFIFETELTGDALTEIQNIIRLMADNGIGGERSTGCGKIEEVVFKPFSINLPEESVYHASMALLIPKVEDVQKIKLHQVKKRGGRYINPGNRIKTVNAVLEGAVIDINAIQAQIIELGDSNFPSWRYGGCLTLPLPEAYSLNTLV